MTSQNPTATDVCEGNDGIERQNIGDIDDDDHVPYSALDQREYHRTNDAAVIQGTKGNQSTTECMNKTNTPSQCEVEDRL